MRRSRLLLLVALPTALLAAAAVLALVNARRVWNRSASVATLEHRLNFELHSLSAAELANPGFEPVASSAGFVSGAFFHGHLYLSGPSGLLVYSSDGVLLHTYRVGSDLPSAPLGALAVGRLRNAPEPELLIATAGEGLLLLDVDGSDRTSFRQLRPSEAEARDITALLPAASGDLIVGTRNHGLLVFTGTSLEPFHAVVPGLDTTKLQITSLAADATGFWAGTHNAGLLHAHAGTVDHLDTASGLPDPQVESIAINQGHVFAGTPLGVAEFDTGTSPARLIRVLAPGLFAHSLGAGSGQLLVGSLDQGMQQIALDARPRLRAAALALNRPEANADPVQQFLRANPSDADGTVYAVTHNLVLRNTGQGQWTPVIRDPAAMLADGNISALAFAPDGSLWVGYFDHGLDILSPRLDRARHLEDDRLFCLNRLALDPRRETMAAATANGLVLFDAAGEPRQTLTRRDGLIADHVTDVAFTPHGMTLATPAGLTFVDDTGTRSLYAFEGLVNNHVYALGHAGSQLLAGTLGGLSILGLDSEAVQRNLTVGNSGLKHNWITAIAPMPDGSWMIGTYGASVLHLARDGSFEPMILPSSIAKDLVINPNAMLVTPGHVYAGTLGHGLMVYRVATQRWSEVTHGLPSANVTALATRDGVLYAGTENGLVRISERALEEASR